MIRTLRGALLPSLVMLLAGRCLLGQTQLALSSGSAPAGSAVVLNLALSSPSGSEPAGIEWTFDYPAGSVASFAVGAGPALSDAAKTLDCAGSAGTYYCVASGLNTNAIANGVVATVSITLAPAANSTTIGVSGAVGTSSNAEPITVTPTSGTASSIIISLLSGIICSPSSLAPNSAAVCTVTLSSPVAGGATVALTSTGSITVPTSVSIAANSASATFSATAGSFTTDQTATITGAMNGISATASLSLVAPVTLSSLACANGSVPASSTTTCTVTLSKGAPTGGATVSLASGATSALTVPSSVTVAQAATTATFTATAAGVTADQTATITATFNGSSKLVSLTVTSPITLTSLACASGSVPASSTTTCTVTLSKSAPTGGGIVSLASSATSALTVPPSVTVAQAATTATFTATAGAVTSDQTATITAAYNGSSKLVSLTVTSPITLTSLVCASTNLTASSTTTCTVTLSKAAAAGGANVSLASSPTSVLTVPPSVTVAQAATTATFTATAAALTSDQTAIITATLNGASKTLAIIVTATAPISLQCASTTLAASTSTICTIRLSKAAPGNGTTVALSSSDVSVVQVPASVTIPRKTSIASFATTAGSVTSNRTATITATASQSTARVTLSVLASVSPTSSLALQLRCEPLQIAPGTTAVCEIRHNADDSANGVEFAVASSSELVRVPAKLRLRGGTVRFEVSSDKTSPPGNVMIEARSDTSDARVTLQLASSETLHLRLPQNLTATPRSPVRFKVEAFDDQGLPSSVTVANKPSGAAFDPTSGLFEWIPADKDLGATEISFTAANSLGFATTKKVAIRVVPSQPILGGLRNAAGSGALAACSPGSLATLVGTSLAGSSSEDAVRVVVNGADASVVRASGERVDFLCPPLAPGTPLGISLEVGSQSSNEVQTVMQKTAPGLLSVDGSGTGLGIVVHARGLAALPRFDRVGAPALAGDAITLFATGVDCDERSAIPRPVLYFGNDYQQITALRPSSFAGVCEVQAVVPAGLPGNEVELSLELVRQDGSLVRSNPVLIAIEK